MAAVFAAVPLALSLLHPSASVATVEVEARSSGPVVSADVYGASLNTWFPFSARFVDPTLAAAGIHLVRWPGGSESDVYHWENGGTVCDGLGTITPSSTFAHLMQRVAQPLDIDVAITLNYGSNPACDAGGLPSEAAAWVAFAKAHGYRVAYWTVGNEVYGSWEYDLHAKPHDPFAYAQAVRTGFYPAVKAADPSVKLGVVVNTPDDRAWNDVVLRRAAPFDFVELHYYPEYTTGNGPKHSDDNDAPLLGKDVDAFAAALRGLRAEMNAAGVPSSVPIYLGEFNSDVGDLGKQSVSIVNGLYLGQMLATSIAAGVPMATWWLAYGSCDETGNYSPSLYGWQHYGSYALFSDGLPNPNDGCPTTPIVPPGTPFPTGRVMGLYAGSVPPGSKALTTVVARPSGTLRAYGYAVRGGYAVVYFNDAPLARSVATRVEGTTRASFVATLATYGQTEYDASRQNRWIGPTVRSLGRIAATFTLTLQPYGMTVVTLK